MIDPALLALVWAVLSAVGLLATAVVATLIAREPQGEATS